MNDTSIRETLRAIRFVAFDFDGIFTDNSVIVSENGKESVLCNRSDGIGLNLLRELGIGLVILSSERNSVVNARARKLRVQCFSGCSDKRKKLEKILMFKHVPLAAVAYLGNDLNDLECMKVVGLPVTVPDGVSEVKRISKIILKTGGGKGAVREFCEMVLKAQSSIAE